MARRQHLQPDSDLPIDLAAPARRALAAAGFDRLEQLAHVSVAQIDHLHGIGPSALNTLRRALAARGLSFADEIETTGASPSAAGAEKIKPKEAAVSFLKLASSGQVSDAYAKYVSANFRHHNPYFQGDAATLATAMAENAAQHPDKAIDIYHVVEEGELVAVHARVRFKPSDRGLATIHLFRFEDGRIAELWDVGQPVPEDSPNTYGMF
jgi:predicted SnoaL-like aldol condensation-catalyzing enzyme